MSGLITVDEALGLLAAHTPILEHETVATAGAQGRMLAEDVHARVSRPPAAVSAMDGYAVRLEDVRSAGTTLNVIGEAPAGAPFSGTVGKGEAVRIFTGGELPAGADHIVIQEDADRDGDRLTCREAYSEAQFVRAQGMDFEEGALILESGTRLGAAELAIAAAANLASLKVTRRPRVGILANGNELKPPGSELGPGEIVNSNPPALAALIRNWGGEPVDLGTAADTLEDIQARIKAARDIDIFLPVGGASVGDHDLMRPAFAAEGFTPVFEKIAVRPGKPTWFSKATHALVLGLPGNPASALVCAHLFLQPLISGQRLRHVRARLAAPLPSNGPREHYMRSEAWIDETGVLLARPADNQDSSLITPFLAGNALCRRTRNTPALEAGEPVDIVLMKPLG
ncbi:MAG: molybdopterin molybdotransferase MoeA [Henriciella sp.]|uniref:molybdopterin molybdotransferase MoeA n=1 Tax=Henriciella sp. TaxID=1968823 RepID=UPI003C77D115